MSLITPAGQFDRAAIMREAHRAYRRMRGRGWTFGQALTFAWGRAREMRAERRREMEAFERFRRAA